MRKAFNFFNSYWITSKELNDKDRLHFLDAIIHYQFTGDKSKLENLSGMAKFAYISQSHSIESQIKGYYDNCKKLNIKPFDNPAIPPAIGATEGAALPPALQVQVQVQGQVQGQGEVQDVIPTFEVFLNEAIGKKKNVNQLDLKLKYDSWVVNGWKDGKGKKIKNWKSKLYNTLPYISEIKQGDNNSKMVF